MTSINSPTAVELSSNIATELSERPISTIEAAATYRRSPSVQGGVAKIHNITREAGDEVNRFLLCALVSESAKHIKARAESNGESLPMTLIVRGVLRSYRAAAREEGGTLSGAKLNMAKLRKLNEKILKEEVTRHITERVDDAKARLARANRLKDEAKIKTETEALDYAITARDQLRTQFK